MTYLLALSLVVNIATAYYFLRFIADERRRQERAVAGLLNRIQAPKEAVIKFAAEAGPEAHVPMDDEQTWKYELEQLGMVAE